MAVCDIQLARESGLHLLSYFKSNFPSLPVNDELLDEALVRGASGFMRKPDSLEELGEAVRSYLPDF